MSESISTSFQLSRIYGQGWSFARSKLAGGETQLDDTHAIGLNPHPADPEQTRWADGFKAGLRGWRGRLPSSSPFRPRGLG